MNLLKYQFVKLLFNVYTPLNIRSIKRNLMSYNVLLYKNNKLINGTDLKLQIYDVKNIKCSYELLAESLNKEIIENNLWLLNENHEHFIKKKRILETNKIDINKNIELFRLSLDVFNFYNNYVNKNISPKCIKKIKYLTHEIQILEIKICEMFLKCHSLQNISYTKLNEIFTVFDKYNVNKKYLVNDPSIIGYNVARLEERLSICKGRIHPPNIKLWMLRFSNKKLDELLSYYELPKSYTVSEKTEELCEILNVSAQEIEDLLKKKPKLAKAHIEPIKEKIKFLLENGCNSKEILLYSNVLHLNYNTLKTRLKILKLRKNYTLHLGHLLIASMFR